METQIINEQYFYDIANAIRRQNGESTLYRPQDMADAILDLPIDYSVISSIIDKTITSFSSDNITCIREYAFYGCLLLTSVTLSGSTFCTGAHDMFTDTPIESGTGYIYVPAELVDRYKGDPNWSTYADQIVAISE